MHQKSDLSSVKFEETPELTTYVSPTYTSLQVMYKVCRVTMPEGVHDTSHVMHHLYNIFTNNALFTKLVWHVEEEQVANIWCTLSIALSGWGPRSATNAPTIKSVTIYARTYDDAVKFLEAFDPSNLTANSRG